MLFVSDRYPHLMVWSQDEPVAQFVNGVFRTDDPQAAAAVRRQTEVREVPDPESAPTLTATTSSGPPPQAGRGSSVAAWLAYARQHHVAIPEGSGRDAIVVACVAAGVTVGRVA